MTLPEVKERGIEIVGCFFGMEGDFNKILYMMNYFNKNFKKRILLRLGYFQSHCLFYFEKET